METCAMYSIRPLPWNTIQGSLETQLAATARDGAATKPEAPADAQNPQAFDLLHLPVFVAADNLRHPTQAPIQLVASLSQLADRVADQLASGRDMTTTFIVPSHEPAANSFDNHDDIVHCAAMSVQCRQGQASAICVDSERHDNDICLALLAKTRMAFANAKLPVAFAGVGLETQKGVGCKHFALYTARKLTQHRALVDQMHAMVRDQSSPAADRTRDQASADLQSKSRDLKFGLAVLTARQLDHQKNFREDPALDDAILRQLDAIENVDKQIHHIERQINASMHKALQPLLPACFFKHAQSTKALARAGQTNHHVPHEPVNRKGETALQRLDRFAPRNAAGAAGDPSSLRTGRMHNASIPERRHRHLVKALALPPQLLAERTARVWEEATRLRT